MFDGTFRDVIVYTYGLRGEGRRVKVWSKDELYNYIGIDLIKFLF